MSVEFGKLHVGDDNNVDNTTPWNSKIVLDGDNALLKE